MIATREKLKSVKLTENSHYLLRRIATEERSNILTIADKIISEYADGYLNKNNNRQD